jgi:hypothetical protein
MSGLAESGHGWAIYENPLWHIDMSPASAAEAALKFNLRRPPQWLWTLAFGQHEEGTPTPGYEPTRKAAMAAFA